LFALLLGELHQVLVHDIADILQVVHEREDADLPLALLAVRLCCESLVR